MGHDVELRSRSLSGPWRAAPADEAHRDEYEVEFDDRSWPIVPVPGHWRMAPAFAHSDGPVRYRTTFDDQEHDEGSRSFLVLDGIFYTSDVWLDGTYLGDTEGYFFPHAFEVTDALAARTEHTLALEVACPRPSDLTAKRALTGLFQHGDVLDPDANPGGIWRPVRLERSGPVRIRHARARCDDVADERAIIGLRVVLDTVEARSIELRTVVTRRGHDDPAVDVVRRQPLAAGENRVEWTVVVPDPERWWPRALGDQAMYDIAVTVTTEDGAASDERHWPIGLRMVELRDWIASVNGERLFLKGASQGPTRLDLADAEPSDFARDVALAVEAGLDLLRVQAHISRPELYDAADAAGLLLWQDLPLQWGYSRTVRGQARRQAREAVDLLAHHPSILLWCGHNEPLAIDGRRRQPVRRTVAQALPSWNRSLLDRAIKTVLEREDGTRPVVAHSGVLPHLPQLEGTDTHLSLGWAAGDDRDLPALLARWPRLARFVGQFGAASVPDHDDFVEPERWPDLPWDDLARHHGLPREILDRRVPPSDFDTYAAWRDATRTYQARLLRYHIETLRRLKYHPTGGFTIASFADSAPAISPAVLDDQRSPKPAYEALRDACRPVIVVVDRPPEHVHPGDELDLEVHVVSDARIVYRDTVLRAYLSMGTERRHAWSWTGEVEADGCVRVGTLPIVVPNPPSDAPVALVLDLELDAADLAVTTQYGTWILVGPHDH